MSASNDPLVPHLPTDDELSLTWKVSPDLLGVLNAEGYFERSNPAWLTTLGWSPEELSATLFFDFLHPDDLQRNYIAFEAIKRGQPVLRFENRYRSKSGEYHWLSWVAVPEGGKFFCSARDITADKLQSAALLSERADSELREQFIAVLGHDLRNPLASISAGAHLLLKEPATDKGKQILAMMQGSVVRMAGMIDNVLDFARGRLGSGLALDKNANEPLEATLRQVVGELQNDIDPQRIEADFQIDEPVYCDRGRIGQLASNLLANALTHGAPEKPVKIQASIKDGMLKLSVTNSGKPISEEAQERLFQPFFRGEVRDSQQGLGLGLYIAFEIAKAHGGTLTVQSSNEETRFVFLMPMIQATP